MSSERKGNYTISSGGVPTLKAGTVSGQVTISKDANRILHASEGMTRQEFLQFHKEACEKLMKITSAKNADYTNGSVKDDAFANFKQVEALSICSVEAGFLARMTDKLSRINSYIKKGELKVKDEGIEDTLLDLANYSILLAGYLKSK